MKTAPAFAAALAVCAAAVLTAAAPVPSAAPASASASASAAADPLERFRRQPLAWSACPDPRLAAAGTECAALSVPLDYREPQGRTLSLAVSRIRAADQAGRRGVLQTNPGGPGNRGLDMPAALRERLSPEAAAGYDIVGMDTRGVGASGGLDCGLTRGTWLRSAGASAAGFAQSLRLAEADADACWNRYPDLLPHLTTRNIARDVDVLRAALGERRTSFFGQSYGALLGAVYAQLFPQRVDRLVLDSALDPARYGVRTIQDMAGPNERALDDFAAWAAARDAAYRLGATPAAVRATVEGLVRRAQAEPIAVDGFRLDGALLPVLLAVCQSDDRDSALYAEVLRQLLDAADGRPVQVGPVLHELLTVVLDPGPAGGADLAAALGILCDDAAMPRPAWWYREAVERSRAAQPVFGPVYNGPLPCAFWRGAPLEPPVEVRTAVPALQIHATGDTHAVYQGALALHARLAGSRLVTVPGRVHTVYLNGYDACADRAVDAYLSTGALPASDTTC
ncbi:alpha/beta hydrolase [Kitasatospora sp. NPDC001547]|uniref:alpha/beta hydrolase n=1 Tax=Kitasatospora sp. NPDC001547 TaxID=3364015 RepID=UPI00369ABF2E|nr:alpha/beta hydrolase [Kitasatospora sp. Xyl93]